MGKSFFNQNILITSENSQWLHPRWVRKSRLSAKRNEIESPRCSFPLAACLRRPHRSHCTWSGSSRLCSTARIKSRWLCPDCKSCTWSWDLIHWLPAWPDTFDILVLGLAYAAVQFSFKLNFSIIISSSDSPRSCLFCSFFQPGQPFFSEKTGYDCWFKLWLFFKMLTHADVYHLNERVQAPLMV